MEMNAIQCEIFQGRKRDKGKPARATSSLAEPESPLTSEHPGWGGEKGNVSRYETQSCPKSTLSPIIGQAFVVRKVFLQCPESSWMGQLIFPPTLGGLNTVVRTKAAIRLSRKTSMVSLLIFSIWPRHREKLLFGLSYELCTKKVQVWGMRNYSI